MGIRQLRRLLHYMKKILSLLVAGLTISALLVGCGQPTEEGDTAPTNTKDAATATAGDTGATAGTAGADTAGAATAGAGTAGAGTTGATGQ